MHFLGILDGSGDIWGVRFPDIDGCVGAGATPDEAIADATAALRDVIAHKQGAGFDLPKARTLAEIMNSGEIEPGEAGIIIPLLLERGRTVAGQ